MPYYLRVEAVYSRQVICTERCDIHRGQTPPIECCGKPIIFTKRTNQAYSLRYYKRTIQSYLRNIDGEICKNPTRHDICIVDILPSPDKQHTRTRTNAFSLEECEICCDEGKVFSLEPCKHKVCEACLVNIAISKRVKTLCPFCRGKFSMPRSVSTIVRQKIRATRERERQLCVEYLHRMGLLRSFIPEAPAPASPSLLPNLPAPPPTPAPATPPISSALTLSTGNDSYFR